MRNFDQTIEEIARRSEKILLRRKRRQRVILHVIPLVLCVAVYVAAQLPFVKSTEPEAPVATDIQLSETNAGADGAICEIHVAGTGISQTYTDAVQLRQISRRLQELTNQKQQMNSPTEGVENETVSTQALVDQFSGTNLESESEDNLSAVVHYSAALGYTITLTGDDGAITQYHLAGMNLENRTTGQTAVLSQQQLQQLLALLEIPEQGKEVTKP